MEEQRNITEGHVRIRQRLDRKSTQSRRPKTLALLGVGTKLYGRRDERSGTYATTLYFVVLYAPILPLAAYRVVDGRNPTYTREPLEPFAAEYLRALAAIIVIGLAIVGIGLYMSSAGRLVRLELAEAATLEEEGSTRDALAAYTSIIDTYGPDNQRVVRPAVHAYLRIFADRVPNPMTVADVHIVDGLHDHYRQLNPYVREPENAVFVHRYLLDWCDEIGTNSTAAAAAVAQITAVGLNMTSPATPELAARRIAAAVTLAHRFGEEWPADALIQFANVMPADELCPDARLVLARIGESPSLLREHFTAVTSVIEACPDEELTRQISTNIQRAYVWADDATRNATIADGGLDLVNFAERHSDDAEAMTAAAKFLRSTGEVTAALALLERLGPVGMRGTQAIVLSAELLSDAGRTEEALAILRHYTDLHLGEYQRVAVRYEQQEDLFIEGIYDAAEAGTLSQQVSIQLQSLPRSEMDSALEAYIQQLISTDSNLASSRRLIESYADVVLASIIRGSLAAELANTTTGADRDALLAEAEASYVAIEVAGQGIAAYHIGLAVVYHRLNRADEADAEVQHIHDSGFSADLADLAAAYRELGLLARARETADVAYSRAISDETRSYVRGLRYLLAETPDDAAQILEEGTENDPRLQRYRDEQEAADLLAAGDENAAIAIYWRLADEEASWATSNSVAANNAAVAYLRVFDLTGDERAMERAEELMAQASRSEPNSAIVASNHYELAISLAMTDAFDDHIDLRILNLSSRELVILAEFANNSDDLIGELSNSPQISRANRQAQLARTLAPQNTYAYESEARIIRWRGDAEAMERVEQAALNVELDRTEAIQLWQDYISGGPHETIGDNITQVADLQHILNNARGSGDTNTTDAARILLAFSITGSVHLSFELDSLQQAQAELEMVGGELFDVRTMIARIQVARALLEIYAADPSLMPNFEQDARTYGIGPLLAYRIYEAGGRAAGALQQHPLIMQLRDRTLSSSPTMLGFMIAELADDQAGRAEHEDFAEDRVQAAYVRLMALIRPYPREQYERDLYLSR